MPSSVADARDLLISSVLCPDPVLYMTTDGSTTKLKRWPGQHTTAKYKAKVSLLGENITLVGAAIQHT